MARFVVITKDPSGFHYTAFADAPDVSAAWGMVKDGSFTKYKPIGLIPVDAFKGAPVNRPQFDQWVEANKHKLFGYEGESDIMGLPSPITPGPRKPKPQVCPEVWFNKPEVDTTDYMAAVRAMCGEAAGKAASGGSK